MAKAKACDAMAKDLSRSQADFRNRERELLTKVSDVQYEFESAKDNLDKAKTEIEILKQEKTVLRENALKADADARQWQKEVDVIERRLHVVQKDNDSLVKARDGFQAIIDNKDHAITAEHQKSSDMREHSENKLFELKAAFIDLQKDSEGQKTINSLLRNQISDIEKDRNRHADLVLDKDRTIDKLKEEIVRMSRSMADSIRELTPKDTTQKDYEAMSSHEFARLRQLTDELKDRQVELERCKMQEDIHQRQYLELKQKLAEAIDEKNNSKRQQDAIAYENQRLKEEQDKFLSDLGEVRQIYESQIDELAIKLRESAEETLRQKAKSAEISKENSQLKFRINEYKQKMASKDVDIQKLTSEKLFELGGVPRTKPTDFLASPSMLRVALENDSQLEGVSPEGREDTLKVLGRLKRTESPEPTKDIWKEDKMKLEWDSLLHRIGTLGSK